MGCVYIRICIPVKVAVHIFRLIKFFFTLAVVCRLSVQNLLHVTLLALRILLWLLDVLKLCIRLRRNRPIKFSYSTNTYMKRTFRGNLQSSKFFILRTTKTTATTTTIIIITRTTTTTLSLSLSTLFASLPLCLSEIHLQNL